MKHYFTSDDVRRHYSGKSLPPLRTVTEMAQEFGLTLRQLSGYLGNAKDAPKPVFKHSGAAGHRNTWYNPAEMREWWKGHNV
jgi:hypothetical protein